MKFFRRSLLALQEPTQRAILGFALLGLFGCQYTEEVGRLPKGDSVNPYANSACGDCDGCCSGPFCMGGNSDAACGKNGEPCEFCGNSLSCIDRSCAACGPSNCDGCCNSIGMCEPGTFSSACGTGGGACKFCGVDDCVASRCER